MRQFVADRTVKRLVASSLLVAAVVSTPLGFLERATAEFLSSNARLYYGGPSQSHLVLQEAVSWHYTVFWFDLAISALLLVLALIVLMRGGHSWYGSAILVAIFAGGSGIWVLLGDPLLVPRWLPVGVLSIALSAVSGLAVVGSIAGWAITAPTEPRMPLSPPCLPATRLARAGPP